MMSGVAPFSKSVRDFSTLNAVRFREKAHPSEYFFVFVYWSILRAPIK